MGGWWVVYGLHKKGGGEWGYGGEQCELRGFIRHDELGDITCFVPMRKKNY